MLKKTLLLVSAASAAFALHNGSININDKDLEVALALDLGQFNATVEPDMTFLGAKFLKSSDEHSSSKVGANGYYELDFLMKRAVNSSGLYAGIGVKANFAKVNDNSFVTIPLGIEAGFKLPLALPTTIGASVYYAPESLAFSDAESFLEYRLMGSIEVIERGSIIFGFRSLDTNFKINATKEALNYNKSGYAGFAFAF